MSDNVTVKGVIDKAKAEINSELMSKYTVTYKEKLRELAKAELLVGNIKRELKDLEQRMENELG